MFAFSMPLQSLDQLVKGAPARPDSSSSVSEEEESSSFPPLVTSARVSSEAAVSVASSSSSPRPLTPDPLSTLPSAPPQIYLNLLILETSLRAQYLALRERRRQNTFFLLLLAAWIAYFSYALFLRPREDGRGVGGSVYWVIEMGERVALLGGVVTALLVWGTGQWDRGVRWPRRWLVVANRGLRTMNTKIVVIRGTWLQELLSYLSFLFPFSVPFFPSPTGNYHYVERHVSDKRGAGRQHRQRSDEPDSESGLIAEDLSPGGDYIRLLLLPKSFSPEFRENWDEYRTNFWEKENERRTVLRQKLRERERQLARHDGAWFWWLGLGWKASQRRRLVAATIQQGEKPHFRQAHHHSLHYQHHQHQHQHYNTSTSPKITTHAQESSKQSARRSGLHSDSQSRTPSRSSTPVDPDDRPSSRGSARSRRGSTAPPSTVPTPEQQAQRRKRSSKSISGSIIRDLSPLTQAQIREGLQPPALASENPPLVGDSLGKENEDDEAQTLPTAA